VTLERRVRTDAQFAQDLAAGAEVIARDWLTHESESIVLSPDASVPAVAVLDEHFDLQGKPVALKVVAWDQCGLVPVAFAAAASPLRLALPDDAAHQADLLSRACAPLGLDELLDANTGTSPFPNVDVTRGHDEDRSLRVLLKDETTKAAGAWLGIRPSNSATLNVHTARKDVLEAAFRDAGRGGLEEVLAARAEHRKTAVAHNAEAKSADSARRIELVGTSDTWAFRIDVEVGSVRASFWTVFLNKGGSWEREQRLFIPG
jgi:hypothetical protein